MHTRTFPPLPAFLVVLFFSLVAGKVSANELIDYVDLALQQSDVVYNLNDMYTLSEMSVAGEEHQFDYRIVPLSNFGVADGTGSQTLGLEVKQKLDYGTELTAGVRGDRTDQDNEYYVTNNNSARVYLKVSQGIFRQWGEKYNLSSLNLAKLEQEEVKLQNERARQDLILQTATNYYQLVLAKQLLQKSEQAWKRSREHLEAAQSRQSAGLVSKVDVYRAELASLNAESSLQDMRQSFNRQRDQFSELLGVLDYQSINVTDEISWVTPIVPDVLEEALLNNRLDWHAHRIKKQYAKVSLYRAKQNTKSDIHLNFNVEQKGVGETIGDATELDETNWSLQLELRSDFDLFTEKANLTRETLKVRKLRREGESLRRKIFREAREAFEDLKTQERSYLINVKRMRQANNALDLTKIRYERGLSDNLDLLDSEDAYSTAELDISRAIIDFNIATIKLAHVLGVLDVEWLQLSLDTVSSEQVSSTGHFPPPLIEVDSRRAVIQ